MMSPNLHDGSGPMVHYTCKSGTVITFTKFHHLTPRSDLIINFTFLKTLDFTGVTICPSTNVGLRSIGIKYTQFVRHNLDIKPMDLAIQCANVVIRLP